MKKQLLTLLLAGASFVSVAQPAVNFTCNDCAATSHDLFTELNAGKVIVLCWVMPCGVCTGPSLTTYNVVQSYATTNPNTVFMYLVDDYANTNCASLNSWANSTGVTNATRFSNAAINMVDYGSTGMPKIVVVGGSNHTVFYNANNTVNATSLQNAINSAILTTGLKEPGNSISSLKVFPNPTPNTSEMQFHLSKAATVTVQLFNLEGQMLGSVYTGQLASGENKIKLELSSYAAGMYLAKISDGDKVNFINVMVAR